MKTKRIMVCCFGGDEDLLGTRYGELLGNKAREPHEDRAEDNRRDYGNLTGNKVRNERRPGRQDVLLTVRRDLEGIRGSLLDGDCESALGEAEYLLDAIDNMLSERC